MKACCLSKTAFFAVISNFLFISLHKITKRLAASSYGYCYMHSLPGFYFPLFILLMKGCGRQRLNPRFLESSSSTQRTPGCSAKTRLLSPFQFFSIFSIRASCPCFTSYFFYLSQENISDVYISLEEGF